MGLRDLQDWRDPVHRVTKGGGSQTLLERTATAGESPVGDTVHPSGSHLKYGGTREIPSEAGPTTVQG